MDALSGGDLVSRLLGEYGYVALALGVLLENTGLPIPGETALLSAAFLAQRGTLSLHWVLIVAAAAAVLGGYAGYAIGRLLGRGWVERHGHVLRLTPERLQRLDRFFEKHGAKTVLFTRFITGLRVFAALFAGLSRMRWRTFLLFNALGGIAWAIAIGLVGYAFGESWHVLHRWLGATAILLAALAAAFFLVHRHRQSIATFVEERRSALRR